MKNQFDLSASQLVDIANDLAGKIEAGLKKDGTEIKCLPTYIHPKKDGIKGNATVFDLGGTNFRVATVEVAEETSITSAAEMDITEMKKKGFTREDLFARQSEVLSKLNVTERSPIGYCFSYPAKSMIDGDAELIKWTKGVGIPKMEGEAIGMPLLTYMNEKCNHNFSAIKVVNDTITSLFAGLLNPGFDAYIGIIVGTGTNMASFFPSSYIPKLKDMKGWSGDTPINLESGNFHPPHLTSFDEMVDAKSDNKSFQRFEKAVSGMYLGEIFKAAFPGDKFDDNFSAVDLSRMLNNPGDYKPEYVEVAFHIYERSAKLVAASLAGLAKNLHSADPKLKTIQVLAEGSLYWSKMKAGRESFAKIVDKHLPLILGQMGLKGVTVKVAHMENSNMIGAAMAVLS